MNKITERYIGFDCGNSSIRTVVGTYDGDRIALEIISQVPNREYRGIKYDHWDILAIFHEMLNGMKLACAAFPDIRSFGISTWGIDFGLLGRSRELLGNPLCYRNVLGTLGMSRLSRRDLDMMFGATGIQNHPMNSLYQLLGIREALGEYYEQAKVLLLIPDLLNYLFTGEVNSETSIFSTTQLLDMRTRRLSEAVLSATGLDKSLFVPMIPHGNVRGTLKQSLAEMYHIPKLHAVSVPSHDTAAAVVCVPSEQERFAFISSGTWSLIGTETSSPIVNDTVMELGFTNEGGVFDSITLLKNSCGMHILQNIKREMESLDSRSYRWDELVALSMPGLGKNDIPTFDPNSDLLYHPDSMIRAITKLTGLQDIGLVLASAYRSLAISYRRAIEDLQTIIGETFDTIHIIGGGSKNDHLNQMTADLTGKTVVSGPEEATSLGIIAVQILHEHPDMSLHDIRTIIRKSVRLGRFVPRC
ncbi:carbohydrate kinase [Treponema parvum]|uniref:Carbohydrate kinase n=1 Tax=Treponema parvum TaxID=138851 RepID=A0A975F4D0_9SPIR|nr:FGGY-family carbohydrate kinase [Treponema parvum]QTQ14242.1 carbohydrate kinase [Treponema parvum]